MSQHDLAQTKKGLRSFVALISGVLFAFGLGISGMTHPEKIIGFLNLTGAWDPSLLFVMIGAIGVHALAYVWVNKKHHPVLDSKMHIPSGKDISGTLIVGSLIFGAGWGLAGFCPGAGLVAVADGNWPAVTFVIAMSVGMIIHHFYYQLTHRPDDLG